MDVEELESFTIDIKKVSDVVDSDVTKKLYIMNCLKTFS